MFVLFLGLAGIEVSLELLGLDESNAFNAIPRREAKALMTKTFLHPARNLFKQTKKP